MKDFNKKSPVGVFDSGVGGLSVLKELIKVLPEENFEYIGDTDRMPYGVRTPEEVMNFTLECLKYLGTKKVKAAIIACNTATCYGLENARKNLDFNVVGVVRPACEYSSSITENKNIALIATQGTVNSKVYEKTLKEIDENIKLREVGAPQLVLDIENGNLDNEKVKNTINGYLEELSDYDYDTLILGCTHFPLAKDMFDKVLKEKDRNVSLVDPANRTALKLKDILSKEDLLNDEKDPKINFYATGNVDEFKKVVNDVIEFNNKSFGKALL